MLAWPTRLFRRPERSPVATDPEEERQVAERLLPLARSVLLAPGSDDPSALLALAERLAPVGHTEVLTPPDVGVEALRALLACKFLVYDAAAAPRRGVLILDRRLGWRVPGWEPLPDAFKTAYRLLWTRLGYYTVQTGTVEQVHAENRVFSFAGRATWVNVAYRDLPLPAPGERLRVLGMFSFLGSTAPVLHALAVEPAEA
ncbi:MAG TPA: hypothetical protein VK066_03240 [Chloroflexota bacterium]|nr:hypothetical protein [Chloroflexota bacterium]